MNQNTFCKYCHRIPSQCGCTHPVKELALTDEEMISIYEKDWSGIKCGLGRAVEQAILRKAGEK